MAGDWIKMRPSLLTNPKVSGIARHLEISKSVAAALSITGNDYMAQVVTRNVMRNVTVAALLMVWGAANEHSTDGVFKNADLSDIDDICGIPGFGMAMESVGWLEYSDEDCTVTLPNFNEYNTCGKDRQAESNAERQKRYREKQKALALLSNENSNVTDDVTRNDREEKRREDKQHTGKPVDLAGFAKFWQTWPKSERKVAKAECAKRWKLRGLENSADEILAHLEGIKDSQKWTSGFAPAPLTYLNQKHWEDGDTGGGKPWES